MPIPTRMGMLRAGQRQEQSILIRLLDRREDYEDRSSRMSGCPGCSITNRLGSLLTCSIWNVSRIASAVQLPSESSTVRVMVSPPCVAFPRGGQLLYGPPD